jgi:hypothetical protein
MRRGRSSASSANQMPAKLKAKARRSTRMTGVQKRTGQLLSITSPPKAPVSNATARPLSAAGS